MIKKTAFSLLFALLLCEAGMAQQLPFTYTYTGKPRFQILTKRNNATLGIINVELFPKIAPRHVRNFDSLVSQQFYDSTAFHRVIPGFVIQGGDPNSRSGPKQTWGYGQPSQPKVKAEFSAARHVRGILSAARSNDINSATSQFFICHANTPNLDGNYSIYGKVTSGINFVDSIAYAPRDNNDNPLVKIEMFVTYIGSNDTVPLPPTLTFPKQDSMNVDTLNPISLKWLARPDGIIYHVQVSTDSTFATTTFTYNTGTLNYYIPFGLKGSTTYFWRVNTNNGGHISAYSPVRRFKTQNADDVGIKERTLSEAQILVYPNPGTESFSFANVYPGDAVEVYDVQGCLLTRIRVMEKEPRLNVEGWSKGLYTYTVRREGRTIGHGKLLLK